MKTRTSGKSIEIAEKLGISRSHLFNYFEELKALRADVRFDKKTEPTTVKIK